MDVKHFVNLPRQLRTMEKRFGEYLENINNFSQTLSPSCKMCKLTSHLCRACIIYDFEAEVTCRNYLAPYFTARVILGGWWGILCPIPKEDLIAARQLWYEELQRRVYVNTGYIFNEETGNLELYGE